MADTFTSLTRGLAPHQKFVLTVLLAQILFAAYVLAMVPLPAHAQVLLVFAVIGYMLWATIRHGSPPAR